MKTYEPFISFDKRSKVWYIYYYNSENKPRRKSTGCTLQRDAKKALREFAPPKVLEGDVLTLAKFHAKFQESDVFKKYTVKSQKHFNVAMRQFIAYVGDVPIAKVSKENIQNFIAAVECDTSIWSARKYYTALASMFERAVDWKHVESNLWREVAKPKEGERRPLFLERDTFDRFLKCVGEYDRWMYVFAVNTGMRLGEVCAAQWRHVDWKKNIITVENSPTFETKNKRSRNIPMTNTLRALLKEIPEDGDFIFGLAPNTVSHRFRQYILAEKWLDQRIHFHSLRHTFASWLVQRHTPLAEVQKLLGHASIKTTEIYAHLIDDTLQDAVMVLDDIQYRQTG